MYIVTPCHPCIPVLNGGDVFTGAKHLSGGHLRGKGGWNAIIKIMQDDDHRMRCWAEKQAAV